MNGQLSYKGNYTNNKKTGYWEKYFPNGKPWYNGNYLNNKQNGYWEEYYSNTNIQSKDFYI